MDTKLIVSASPHVRSEETTQSLMANVIVALCPCVVASAIIFGMRALLVTAVSVVACVVFEWLYCKLLKKPNPISDLSAVVTGIILAMNVPVGMPIGQLIIGDLVAIVIVKQLFGGIGMNFANPALVGRIVLFISFAGSMNKWVFPDAAVDQLSSATPLAVADKSKLSLLDLFMGIHGGVLGETCALAIVLGLDLSGGHQDHQHRHPGFLRRQHVRVLPHCYPQCARGSGCRAERRPAVRCRVHGYRLRYQPLHPEGQAGVRRGTGHRHLCHPLLGQLHRGRVLRTAVHEPVGSLHQRSDPSDPVWLHQACKESKGGCWQMSKSSNWESTIKPIVVLSVISLIASLLLALVNGMTAPVIAENTKRTTLAAYVGVLPSVSDASELEEVTDYTTAGITGVVKAPDGSTAIKAEEKGFDGGILTVIMGFDANGAETGIWVDASTQTKGIGSNVSSDDFLAQFDGMDGTQNIVMNQDYDAYSGATISSTALFAAINDCVNCYNELA